MTIRDDFVREVVQSVPVMLGYVDREQRYKYANRAYLEWNSTSLDAILDRKVSDFFGQDVYATIKPRIEAALNGEEQRFFVERIARMGQVRTLQASYVPDIRADKTVRGLFFSILDISDHLVAGSDPKAMFERIFESGPTGIVLVDSEFRFLSVNQRFCQMLGYEAEELIGRKFVDITHPDDIDVSTTQTQGAFEGVGQFPKLEKRYKRKDGQIIYGYVMASVIRGAHGEPPRAIAIVEDITERKSTEERLRRAERVAAIGELSGGIAHDFNNLLSIILGNLDLIEEKLEVLPGAGEACERLVKSATAAAERGASLTQRLLAFSRKQALEPVVLDLNNVVAQMDDMLRRTLLAEIDIEVIRCAGLWRCEADHSQLENALVNLAINARDAMPGGGRLTIETANVVLDEQYVLGREELISGQYVMLAVTDTGYGMPSDIIQQSIEPFFTTKDVGRGSGLGLSMVYGFVKQSGGHLSIYSEEDEGTVIKIYLPRTFLDANDSDQKIFDTAQSLRANGQTVLLVEDDTDLRTLTKSLLEDLGYKVYEAEHGQEALSQFATLPRVDLLLTDVVLPGGIGGRELSELLVSRDDTLCVLYMSGYTENSIVHNGRLDTGALLLQKPFRKEKLAEKVTQALLTGSHVRHQ